MDHEELVSAVADIQGVLSSIAKGKHADGFTGPEFVDAMARDRGWGENKTNRFLTVAWKAGLVRRVGTKPVENRDGSTRQAVAYAFVAKPKKKVK